MRDEEHEDSPLACLVHVELMQDVCSHSWSGSGRESHDGDSWELVSQLTQLLVVWSEVMPPLTDTMSFIYHKTKMKIKIIGERDTIRGNSIEICWRASEASETVLGVDNAKSGICYIYVCMDGWYVCSLNARAGNVFLLKTRLFRLDSSLF